MIKLLVAPFMALASAFGFQCAPAPEIGTNGQWCNGMTEGDTCACVLLGGAVKYRTYDRVCDMSMRWTAPSQAERDSCARAIATPFPVTGPPACYSVQPGSVV